MEQIDRFKRVKSVLEDARMICDKLDMVAVEEGVRDENELALLSLIRKNIQKYDDLLQAVLEDGVVSDEELRQVKKFEMNLTQAIQQQTIADGKITSEEEHIVNTLFDCLQTLNSIDIH